MSSQTQTTERKRFALDPHRVIGSIEGMDEGPTIIVLAGVHGNEPFGVKALENTIEMLQAGQMRFQGYFIGIRANLKALGNEVRYVDEDMNRIWFPSIVEHIRETPVDELESYERVEMKKLMALIDEAIDKSGSEPVILVDLHSFSAEGCMFAITSPKGENVNLLSNLNIPMIFGIENTLRGTVLRYYQDRGYETFALEGGQHTNELTIYNLTAALMAMFYETGFIKEEDISEVEEYKNHLKEHTRFVPEKVELVYQHIIEEGDDFSMRPGFKNFQSVKKGEWLANDVEGKIHALCDGFIVMPLYQDQGNDGFFIVQEQS